uniref:BH4_AAA_HYDROXYL_2 domain-containing protein n=1 Tax=Globodera pallida TaxID=36090 RepID=A0A183BXU9_GLOPA
MHLVLSLHCSGDSRDVLQSALAKFSFIGLHLGHLETRPDLAHPGELEIRAQLSGKKVQFLDALTKLYACSDGPGHELFEPEVTALRPYADSDYQPVYFVAESIQKAMDSVRAYARSICPQRVNIYHPLSRTIQSVSTHTLVDCRMGQLQRKCAELCHLMETMKAETILEEEK